MWISKKKWNALVDRVSRLEKDQALIDIGGEITPWKLVFEENLPINRVVAWLAKHAGLVYDHGTPAGLKEKQK